MPNRSQEHMIREGRTPSNGEAIIVKTYPSITGTPTVGEDLTAVLPTFLPASGVTSARQWFRGRTAIGGATGATYTLVEADEGEYITLRVILTHANLPARTLFSKPAGPVAAAAP